jgi:hypothetical protein
VNATGTPSRDVMHVSAGSMNGFAAGAERERGSWTRSPAADGHRGGLADLSEREPRACWLQVTTRSRPMSEVTEYEASCRALVRANGQRILERLRELGVASAQADYNGYGDSGQLETVELIGGGGDAARACVTVGRVEQRFEDGRWTRVVEEREVALDEALKDLFYDALEMLAPGWEINDGSQGLVSLTVATGKIDLCHDWNVTQTERFEIGIDVAA